MAFQSGTQKSNSITSDLTCNAKAGAESDTLNCFNSFVSAGTSNTKKHELTSIALIRFPLDSKFTLKSQIFKTILKLNIEEVLGTNDIILQVLGIRSTSSILNHSATSWSALSSSSFGIQILKNLTSGNKIDSVNKNFINWSSLSDLSKVGHVTANYRLKAQSKIFDVMLQIMLKVL